jgi:hypothetical protein
MVLNVTVAMACHSSRRWTNIGAALRSLLAQSHRPAAVVVSVDHKSVAGDGYRRSVRHSAGRP